MDIMLAPRPAGRLFTAESWTAEVDHCEDVHAPWRYRKLSVIGLDKEDALAALKRNIRELGYRGEFRSYVDVWRHY